MNDPVEPHSIQNPTRLTYSFLFYDQPGVIEQSQAEDYVKAFLDRINMGSDACGGRKVYLKKQLTKLHPAEGLFIIKIWLTNKRIMNT